MNTQHDDRIEGAAPVSRGARLAAFGLLALLALLGALALKGGAAAWMARPSLMAGAAVLVPAPASETTQVPAAGDSGDGGDRRRLFLGRAGRVPACRGRQPGGLGLFRRHADTAVYQRVGPGRPATRKRSRSPSTRARSPTAASCRSSSRWRTTRPSSIARPRTSDRSTARRSSRPTRSRRRSPRPISPSSTRRGSFIRRSSPSEPDREILCGRGLSPGLCDPAPDSPTSSINDLPKVENLKRLFPEIYRDDPVLVSAAPR